MKKNRPWFALLAFCAAYAILAALALAILFAGASFALAFAEHEHAASAVEASSAPAEAQSTSAQRFTGLATDDRCGARHSSMSGMGPSECVRHCIRDGAQYALINGEHSYTLTGNPSELERVAGQRVTVAGTLQGNTITVIEIAAQ